jgi:hypothetical protein
MRLLLTSGSGGGKTSIIKRLAQEMAKTGYVIYCTDNADELVVLMRDKMRGTGIPIRCVSMKYSDGVGLKISPMMATANDRQLYAKKIVGESKGKDDFWIAWATILLENVAHVLSKMGSAEELFADHVRILLKPDLHSALSVQAGLGDPYQIFGNNNSKRDVQATLTTKLAPFGIFAAMDMRCKERVTLPITEGFLVVEMTDQFMGSLSGIASFIFDSITDAYLSRQSSEPVAIVIDEFRELAALDCIDKIARRGRKSGMSLILTMHEIMGVHDRYGKDRGEELMGLMDEKIFLRIGSPTTAKWSSENLGEIEVVEDVAPRSTDGKNTSYSRRVYMRPNVIPDELRRLKRSSYKDDEITGWYDGPDETVKFTCKFRDAVTLSKSPAPRQLRPASHQELPRLDESDLKRLNIRVTQELRDLLK